jgi:hypothetical protein
LALGPNYALAKDPKDYSNELIIDTEDAIRQLDPKIQNTLHGVHKDKTNKDNQHTPYPTQKM